MSNLTVVITRASHQSAHLVTALRNKNLQVIQAPSIKTVPITLDSQQLLILESLLKGKFEWLILTSQNGVEQLARFLDKKGDLKEILPRNLLIASQGDKTAQRVIEIFNRNSQKIPSSYIAEALTEEFTEDELKGNSVLLVRAKETRGVIVPALKTKGAKITELILYETVAQTIELAILEQIIACPAERLIFTFFSPSAFKYFITNLDSKLINHLKSSRILSIGPVTSKAIEISGYKVFKEASDHSEEGVLNLLLKL